MRGWGGWSRNGWPRCMANGRGSSPPSWCPVADPIIRGGEIGMDSRLQVTQIDHCSVVITDVDRSRRFYGGVLGLKEIPKPRTFDFRVVWFDLGNQHLHLLLQDRADTISPRHFALRVPDAAAARTYFRERQV